MHVKAKKSMLLIIVLCTLIDQISKVIVSSKLILYNKVKIINNFFCLTYVKNDGAAWSILSGNRILLIIITILAITLITKYIMSEKKLNKYDIISYGMLLGGIIGNFIDRLVHGYVIDFFDFNIFGYNYPVFNFADIFIVISVIMMTITYLRGVVNENNSR